MKILIFPLSLIVLISCGREKSVTPLPEPKLITDSIYFSDFNFNIKLNTFGEFDTSFQASESNCTYYHLGTKFINSSYEDAIPYTPDWYYPQSDSSLNLTIFPSNEGRLRITDFNYLQGMYDQQTALRKAMAKNFHPLFANSELINGRRFCYIAYSDSINKNNLTYNEIHLKAVSFLDSTKIEFKFTCFARDAAKKTPTFLKILRSVEIEPQLLRD